MASAKCNGWGKRSRILRSKHIVKAQSCSRSVRFFHKTSPACAARPRDPPGTATTVIVPKATRGMLLPCVGHVPGMRVACSWNAPGMLLPCSCHASAPLLPRSCHALRMRLPCSCHVLAMLLTCSIPPRGPPSTAATAIIPKATPGVLKFPVCLGERNL